MEQLNIVKTEKQDDYKKPPAKRKREVLKEESDGLELVSLLNKRPKLNTDSTQPQR